MSQEEQDRRVDYIEFPTTNIGEIKSFYSGVFGWKFTDFGPRLHEFHRRSLNRRFCRRGGSDFGRSINRSLMPRAWQRSKNESVRAADRSSGRHSSFPVDADSTSPIRAEMSWRSGPIGDLGLTKLRPSISVETMVEVGRK